MGLFDWDKTDEEERPVAIFEFESGTRCAVCGLHHADQWQCDPTILNPWG
jgi:hypothetical protein